MSYKITCGDMGIEYGPFRDEGDAYRYAGLLDIDPACKDTEHEVEWFLNLNKPLPLGELRQAVVTRILEKAGVSIA